MKHDNHQKWKLMKVILSTNQERIAKDVRENMKVANKDNYLDKKMIDEGVKFFEAGNLLEDASLELRENKSFIYGYERAIKIQENRQEVYDIGVQKYIDGVHLGEVSEIYRSNQDFMQGYMDAKAQSLIEGIDWKNIPDDFSDYNDFDIDYEDVGSHRKKR